MTFFGYIDPGTGSIFLQAIIGTGLAVIVVFRRFIGKLWYGLKKPFGRRPLEDDQE